MTTAEQQATATGQSANGQAPGPIPPAEDTTGERWLGILVITAGAFLLLIGIDRVTGGALSGVLAGRDGQE